MLCPPPPPNPGRRSLRLRLAVTAVAAGAGNAGVRATTARARRLRRAACPVGAPWAGRAANGAGRKGSRRHAVHGSPGRGAGFAGRWEGSYPMGRETAVPAPRACRPCPRVPTAAVQTRQGHSRSSKGGTLPPGPQAQAPGRLYGAPSPCATTLATAAAAIAAPPPPPPPPPPAAAAPPPPAAPAPPAPAPAGALAAVVSRRARSSASGGSSRPTAGRPPLIQASNSAPSAARSAAPAGPPALTSCRRGAAGGAGGGGGGDGGPGTGAARECGLRVADASTVRERRARVAARLIAAPCTPWARVPEEFQNACAEMAGFGPDSNAADAPPPPMAF
jgi:hypothetical protein